MTEGGDDDHGGGGPAPGEPCWANLSSPAVEESVEFYRALFGWTFTEAVGYPLPYRLAELDGARVAGVSELADPAGPARWTPYLGSADANDAASRIHIACGTVGVGPKDIAGDARVVLAADSFGAGFGIYQALGRPGFEATGRAGTVVRCELHTPDPDAEAAFYRTALDLPPHDGAESLPWPVVTVPPQTPSRWLLCFGVRDLALALGEVAARGGRIEEPGHPAPPGAAERTLIRDPAGAELALTEVSSARQAG